MTTTIRNYEGNYESADGVEFEARYSEELELFFLSRNDNPGDMKTIDSAAFVETVETGRVTALN
ncbi:hypothetical protein SAMN05421858_5068 [Haladaptatus litoreus]|uniref:Uncharacterized protein n=1 Tax=Haladaptatus litoreus TaxID=553468 RepID=A0A1N7FHM8_9EURY|nr:hypothetical protein [Haladaptatus litoreus]SIR99823.1 hypothetical protein SAMN05421858_5068 [Haladaptatus litoreus]